MAARKTKSADLRARVTKALEDVYAELRRQRGGSGIRRASEAAAFYRLEELLIEAQLFERPAPTDPADRLSMIRPGDPIPVDLLTWFSERIDECAALFRSGEEREAVEGLWCRIERSPLNCIRVPFDAAHPLDDDERQKEVIRRWLANHGDWGKATKKKPPTGITTFEIMKELTLDLGVNVGTLSTAVGRRKQLKRSR